MASKPRLWTCQRRQGGVKCGAKNPRIKRNCQVCGKPRPKTKPAAHRQALELPYEAFVILNGGDHCGICGTPRERGGRRLDRDHAWVGPIKGRPRGLLCHSCNRTLSRRMEISASSMGLAAWLRAAADYVERAERCSGMNLRAFL